MINYNDTSAQQSRENNQNNSNHSIANQTGNASSDQDRRRFAEALMECYRKKNGDDNLTYDSSSFTMSGEHEGSEWKMSLMKPFDEYRKGESRDRSIVLDYYSDILSEGVPTLPSTYDEAKADLLPRIVNQTYISSRNDCLRPGGPYVARPLCANLGVALYYDMPKLSMPVTKEMFSIWGTCEEEVMKDAHRNLSELIHCGQSLGRTMSLAEMAAQTNCSQEQILEDIQSLLSCDSADASAPLASSASSASTASLDTHIHILPMQGSQIADTRYKGLKTIDASDAYTPSRLLDTEFMREVPVRGDIVVMVPQRDCILITGTEESEGLCGMATLAQESFGNNDMVSTIAIRLTDEGWTQYLPDPSHPAYDSLHSLSVKSSGSDYSAQEKLLHGKSDEVVSSFWTLSLPDSQKEISCSEWTEGIVNFLPQTEFVGLMSQEAMKNIDTVQSEKGDVLFIPWDKLMAVVGHRLEKSELYPPRYRTNGYPSENELMELRKCDTDDPFSRVLTK